MKRDGEEDIQGPRERRDRPERRADERRTRQNGTAKQKAGKRAETVWETETGPCLLLLSSVLSRARTPPSLLLSLTSGFFVSSFRSGRLELGVVVVVVVAVAVAVGRWSRRVECRRG
jgi:hypothetical protein